MENRLLLAIEAGGVQASFGCDPLGRRDSYTVNSNTTRYLSDGIEEIADYDDTDTLLRRYVHGPVIDERLVMYTGTSLTSKEYYHTDHQGTTVAMSNNAGGLTDEYTYSAFGEVGAEGPGGNPFRYTGRRLDAETGLHYYRARYYSPTLGRFLQADPIGYKDQLNLYTYVANDPVNTLDPHGLRRVELERKLVTAGSRITQTLKVSVETDLDDDALQAIADQLPDQFYVENNGRDFGKYDSGEPGYLDSNVVRDDAGTRMSEDEFGLVFRSVGG